MTVAALMLGAEIAGRALARLFPREGQAWRQAFGNASLWAFLAGLVGARLWYAALHSAIYQEDPWLLLSLRPDALAYVPGLTLGLGCLIVLLRRKGVPLAALADAIAAGSRGGAARFLPCAIILSALGMASPCSCFGRRMWKGCAILCSYMRQRC